MNISSIIYWALSIIQCLNMWFPHKKIHLSFLHTSEQIGKKSGIDRCSLDVLKVWAFHCFGVVSRKISGCYWNSFSILPASFLRQMRESLGGFDFSKLSPLLWICLCGVTFLHRKHKFLERTCERSVLFWNLMPPSWDDVWAEVGGTCLIVRNAAGKETYRHSLS